MCSNLYNIGSNKKITCTGLVTRFKMNIVGICCPYILCKAKGLFNWTLESCLLNICSSIGRDLPPWDGPIWKDICKLLVCTVTICIDSVPSNFTAFFKLWVLGYIKNRRPCLHIGLTEQQLIPLYKQQRDTYIHAVFCISNGSASVASTNPSEGTVHKAPNAITSTRCINCPRVLLNSLAREPWVPASNFFFRNEWRDRSHYP